MRSALFWRPMAPADLPAVGAIARASYPDHPEDAEIFHERLSLFPQGCFVLERDTAVVGYILSYPARFGDPPPLNQLLGSLPAHADCYYIHDLALLPPARGTGAAQQIIARVAALAAQLGFARITLVSVNGTVPFWTRSGFVPEHAPAIAAKLASYGGESAYLCAPSPA
ncbi:GNAT family N-acetyltransferase [Hephaestia sp. GCM10023244]|uniref:GNAT family N-acetyltransferase n=1 Tax=unclassified Hephaestia TaxID=2631281 RepID=UPI00207796C3|nr:GNAT family N-acetyltransferase [Hephaestia sp. MAHUQ-44]MCM8729389.1 GNAT family N-acetyltransferase [Hephaestia sp. MAHUQ-44]